MSPPTIIPVSNFFNLVLVLNTGVSFEFLVVAIGGFVGF